MVDQLPPSNAPEAMLPWIKAIEAGQRAGATAVRQVATQQAAATTFAAKSADKATLATNQITADRRVPALMTDLTASGVAYFDQDGVSRAYITLAWPAVTTADDGSDMPRVSYEVWFRNAQEPDTAMRRATATSELTSRINNLESNLTYFVQVRAVSDKGIPGDFSNSTPVLTPSATDVPSTPSAPTVTTSLGSVTVTWDGLMGGISMPNWVASVQVMVSTTSGGAYAAVGTPLTKAGSVTLADLTPGTTYYFKLRAVSKTGVYSLLSTTSSVAVAPISSANIPGLDANLTAAYNQANSAFAQANSAFGQANTATTSATAANTLATAANTLAGTANTRATSANTLATTANTKATAADANAVAANTLAATANTKATAADANATAANTLATTANSTATSAYGQANSAFLLANTANGTAQTALSAANGKNKTVWSTVAPASITGYVAGDTWFLESNTGTGNITGTWRFNGTTWISRPIDSVAIAYIDAAKISTGFLDVANRIQANTINGNQIAANTVYANTVIVPGSIIGNDLIASGTITGPLIQGNAIDGKVITGAIVRTGATNPRVELDTYGFHGYAANAVEVTSVGTDGKLAAVDAVISGTYRTSPVGSGRRIEITPNTNPYASSSTDGSAAIQMLLSEPVVVANGVGSYSYSSGTFTSVDTTAKTAQTVLTGPTFSKSLSASSGSSASGGMITVNQTWTGLGTNVADYSRGSMYIQSGSVTIQSDNAVSFTSGVNVSGAATISDTLSVTNAAFAKSMTVTPGAAVPGFIHTDPSNRRTVQTNVGSLEMFSGPNPLARLSTGSNTTANTTTANAFVALQASYPAGFSGVSAALTLTNNAAALATEAKLDAGRVIDLNAPMIRMNNRVFGIPSYTTAQRGTYFPSPLEGDRYYDTTLQADMIYYSTAQVAVAGWYPVAGRIPSMVRNRNTTGTLSPSTFATVQLPNLEGLATAGMTYNATTGEITVAQRGLYSILSSITIPMGGGYRVINQLSVNGVTSMYETATVSVNGTVTLQNAQQIVLPANSVVKLSARMDEPTARDLTNARLGITYLGPA